MTDTTHDTHDSQSPTSFRLLLHSAERLIAEKGCRKTTLQDIMNDTGLSKGAIYHYVGSKDELFGILLRERMNKVNARFFEAAEQYGDLVNPMRAITLGIEELQDEKDVSNRILIYLLSQRENPVVERTLAEFYEQSFAMSLKWIETGQRAGVIPVAADARKLADLFVLIGFGMRVRGMAAQSPAAFTAEDMFGLMHSMLGGGKESEKAMDAEL